LPIAILSIPSAEQAAAQQSEFIAFLILAAVAIGASFLFVLLSHVFGGHRFVEEKFMAYECGIKDIEEDLGKRLPIKFFRTAILFVLFGIEVIFFFPWAILLKGTDRVFSVFLYFEFLFFILVLLIGYIYALRRNAFKWD
jgi:NADH-quinone oxidoreductase subunit A